MIIQAAIRINKKVENCSNEDVLNSFVKQLSEMAEAAKDFDIEICDVALVCRQFRVKDILHHSLVKEVCKIAHADPMGVGVAKHIQEALKDEKTRLAEEHGLDLGYLSYLLCHTISELKRKGEDKLPTGGPSLQRLTTALGNESFAMQLD